jgi:DNA (cytosine-5)-methyltransferase 1
MTTPDEPFVAFDGNYSGHFDITNDGTISPTVKTASSTGGNPPAIATSGNRTIVRKLTPLECERLMGWADNYTLNGIDDDGNPVTLANTNRYRICGNGIVANVTQWIGERLP